jgi:hypothetical protein
MPIDLDTFLCLMRLKRMSARTSQITEAVGNSNELLTSSRSLLSGPAPDTFLGRKTQEAFPQENRDR